MYDGQTTMGSRGTEKANNDPRRLLKYFPTVGRCDPGGRGISGERDFPLNVNNGEYGILGNFGPYGFSL